MPIIDIDKKRGVESKQHLKRAFKHPFYKKEKKNKNSVIIPIGVDSCGNDFFDDLRKSHHIFLLGSIYSGVGMFKKVYIESLVDQFNSNECKIAIIDTTKSMGDYSELPHLIFPITEADNEIKNLISWIKYEIERRYQLLLKTTSINIFRYNDKHKNKIPYIAIVVTEIMDVLGKESDEDILKIMYMAKAMGIYFLFSSQIPAKDVIVRRIRHDSGTKIAFKLPNSESSELIINKAGAENLLGQGDLIIDKLGEPRLRRCQGYMIGE